MPGKATRGVATAPRQTALVILDLLLAARFGVAQQVQRVHGRAPGRFASPLGRSFAQIAAAAKRTGGRRGAVGRRHDSADTFG